MVHSHGYMAHVYIKISAGLRPKLWIYAGVAETEFGGKLSF